MDFRSLEPPETLSLGSNSEVSPLFDFLGFLGALSGYGLFLVLTALAISGSRGKIAEYFSHAR